MSGYQRKMGILLNFCNEAAKILTALLYTPVMLRLLGQWEYGLYQLAVSVVSWLGLLEFGFGSGYLRFFARCREDREEEARLNGMFALIFGCLAALSLLCGGILAANAGRVFGNGLTKPELAKASCLLALLTGNLSLSLVNSLFDGYIAAREGFCFQKLLWLLRSVLSPFLTLPLFLLGWGSEAMASVLLALTAAMLAGNIRFCRKRLHMAFSFRGLALSRLKELWGFTLFVFLNQIIDQVNWSVDKFLLGCTLGTAAVAVYGVGAQINSLYIQISAGIAAVFLPKVNRLGARDRDGELSRLLAEVGSLQGMVLFPVLSGFALFGKVFLALWAGPGYEESYSVALLLMAPVTLPLMQNLGIEIQRTKNKHRTRSLVYGVLAIENVLLSRMLIPRWGCTGAAAGTAVALILGNGLFMNWYYPNRLGLDMVPFWKTVGRLLPVCLLTMLFGALLRAGLEIRSWGSLTAAVMLYCAVYVLLLMAAKKKGQAEACP